MEAKAAIVSISLRFGMLQRTGDARLCGAGIDGQSLAMWHEMASTASLLSLVFVGSGWQECSGPICHKIKKRIPHSLCGSKHACRQLAGDSTQFQRDYVLYGVGNIQASVCGTSSPWTLDGVVLQKEVRPAPED